MQDITLLINKKIEMADNENLNSENLDKNNKEQNNSTISKSTQNETKEEKSKEENSDAIKKKKMKSDSKTESPLKKDDDSIKSAPNQKTKSRIIIIKKGIHLWTPTQPQQMLQEPWQKQKKNSIQII